MLERYLVQVCEKVNYTDDDFGQRRATTTETLACRWRDIPRRERSAQMDYEDSDSMVWFAPGTDVAEGDILLFEGQSYEIRRINRARKLGGTQVQFLKCDTRRTNIGVS